MANYSSKRADTERTQNISSPNNGITYVFTNEYKHELLLAES